MSARLLSSVSEAVVHVLSQFGVQNFQKGRMAISDQIIKTQHVTVLVGLTQGIRGRIVYSMGQDTACKLASSMMMGMPVPSLDEMAQSAVTEVANMITGHAATLCASADRSIDISPPDLLVGDNNSVHVDCDKTVFIELITEIGQIHLYIGMNNKAA